MTTPAATTAVPPTAGTTTMFRNRTYPNLSHYIQYAQGQAAKLYTGTVDAATGTAHWVQENRASVAVTAAQSIPAVGLGLQAVGTARADTSQGAQSTYNWGILLSAGNGGYHVVAQGYNALSNSETPGNLPRFTLGALEIIGAGMYAFGGPNTNTQAAGAAVQAAATVGQVMYTNWQNNAQQQHTVPSTSLPVTAPAPPVASAAPQLTPVSVDTNLGLTYTSNAYSAHQPPPSNGHGGNGNGAYSTGNGGNGNGNGGNRRGRGGGAR
jgi:hypothetical protein